MKRQLKMARRGFAFLVLAAAGRPASPAAGAGEPGPLPGVTFLAHWIAQAQFAGYYVAEAKGLYREHGLDVAILDGGPRRPVGPLLASGEATFASHFLSSALKLRDEGLPLVHLAQITQRSALMLVAHKSSGIESVNDLDGKKVSLWPDFSVQPRALFRKRNLHVRTVTQGPTINLFMRGGVDAASAMWYNEYHLFLNSGVNEDEMTLIFYDQHGLNFPEDGIYCLAATWRANPDVCRRFVRATLLGWQYAAGHREEALNIVMQRANRAHTGTNRAHQGWMLDRMCELVRPVDPAARPGDLPREAYERVADALKDSAEIKLAPAFEEFHVSVSP